MIPLILRTDVFFPANNRHRLWQQIGLPCQFGIGIFGRVRPQKGVHHFVNACLDVLPNHPDFGAVIVGAIAEADREFVAELQHKIIEQGLEARIRFLGEQDFAEIPGLFRAMTLICALSNNEGFGLTVLEAMASGAAVLATQAGAWPDIIRQGVDGYCVEADNYTAIRDALAKLLENPTALAKMGQQGREHALQHYPIEREADLLCQFYRQLQTKHLHAQQAAG